MLEACQACDYEQYTDVWDEMIETVTTQLESTWNISRWHTGAMYGGGDDGDDEDDDVRVPEDTKVLVLETSDITDFFTQYKPNQKLRTKNEESLNVCNFHPTSAMLRKLRTAERYYRQLVANVDYVSHNQ